MQCSMMAMWPQCGQTMISETKLHFVHFVHFVSAASSGRFTTSTREMHSEVH